ncbi:FKBP-type peptidyl-prolyl cis-trans isomerase [Nonomuraea sp. ATR24]|uniref:FKBP-type peptidyl-prolyl cis-trans isomerase n=1 Tax=unclassified Nonomuraea TaxID=2593643 RepID=UPI0033F63707
MRLLWPAVLVLATSCGVADSGTLPVVAGPVGAPPEVTIPPGKPGRTPRVVLLSHGAGRRTMPGDVVLADVEIRRWSGNEPHLSTYEANQPVTVVFDGRAVPRTWQEALIGRAAGSRVLLVGPAVQTLGPDMRLDGVPPAETLVVVFDIIGGYPPDARLVGRPLPTVPADLTPAAPARTLIGGSGAEVMPGDKIVIQYVAASWPTREVVDSSYKRGGPSAYRLTPDTVPPGWVDGLRGQRVGGRVAIGSPTSSRGEPTLYVIDILDAL